MRNRQNILWKIYEFILCNEKNQRSKRPCELFSQDSSWVWKRCSCNSLLSDYLLARYKTKVFILQNRQILVWWARIMNIRNQASKKAIDWTMIHSNIIQKTGSYYRICGRLKPAQYLVYQVVLRTLSELGAFSKFAFGNTKFDTREWKIWQWRM